jgi:hypothetical protein
MHTKLNIYIFIQIHELTDMLIQHWWYSTLIYKVGHTDLHKDIVDNGTE